MTIPEMKELLDNCTLKDLQEMQRFGFARVDHPLFREDEVYDYFCKLLDARIQENAFRARMQTQVPGRQSEFQGDGRK